MRRLLLVFLACAVADQARAQIVGGEWNRAWRFEAQPNDYLGYSVSCAGDVDGDGIDDIIAGAPDADPGGLTNAGSVFVYSGATGAVLWRFDGPMPGDFLGRTVSGAGDIDGDGHDDLIAGAPEASPGGLAHAGTAFVYSGATGAVLWRFDGQAANDKLGRSVSRAGNVDGDSVPDLIVGADSANPGGTYRAGSAYVYSGASGTEIWRFDGQGQSYYFGTSVSGAGDVDGDGRDDLIVGAPRADAGGIWYSGSAYVYSGASGALLWRFDGQSTFEWQGSSVSGAGDVDGDGFADLIVGAPEASPSGIANAGSAWIYSGTTGTVLHGFHGTRSGDLMGSCVSAAGDIDQDGGDDIIVGARNAGLSDEGGAFIFSGITGELIWNRAGDSGYDHFGQAVSGGGDIDGNGVDDVIVGAPGAGLINAGVTSVYSLNPFVVLSAQETSYSINPLIQVDLAFPPSEAGARFAILLSAAGIGPSTLNGLDIPLAQDALFQRMLGNPKLVGDLDGFANATVALRLHRQAPIGAVGRTLHLAATTFDAGTQNGRMTSIVRYLVITP